MGRSDTHHDWGQAAIEQDDNASHVLLDDSVK
jgi:hypothetical protein